MTMTDPIADMLTKIRNANTRGQNKTDISSSRLKLEIARILKGEAFIDNYTLLKDNEQGILRIYLRYGPGKVRLIRGLKRISRPGRRVYAEKKQIPSVLKGTGIAILTTSRGILTDSQARRLGVGGEVICYVW